MSLLGSAFEDTVSLFKTEIKSEIDPVGQIYDTAINEPLYVESTVESARNASVMSKRIENVKVVSGDSITEVIPQAVIETIETVNNIFPAIITGSVSHQWSDEEYRWQYQWYEARMNWSDGQMVQDELGRSGNGAWNLYELPNMEEVASGILVTGVYYPPQLPPLPIGALANGDSIKVGVMMYEMLDDQENLRYVFSVPNSHDGICTE